MWWTVHRPRARLVAGGIPLRSHVARTSGRFDESPTTGDRWIPTMRFAQPPCRHCTAHHSDSACAGRMQPRPTATALLSRPVPAPVRRSRRSGDGPPHLCHPSSSQGGRAKYRPPLGCYFTPWSEIVRPGLPPSKNFVLYQSVETSTAGRELDRFMQNKWQAELIPARCAYQSGRAEPESRPTVNTVT